MKKKCNCNKITNSPITSKKISLNLGDEVIVSYGKSSKKGVIVNIQIVDGYLRKYLFFGKKIKQINYLVNFSVEPNLFDDTMSFWYPSQRIIKYDKREKNLLQ